MTAGHTRFFFLVCVLVALAAGMATAADTPSNAPAPDPHAHLQQILQRPLFQAWRLRQAEKETTSATKFDLGDGEWAKRYFGWIGDFFNWLFSSKNQPSPRSFPSASNALPALLKFAAWTIVIIGVIALLLVALGMLSRKPTSTTMARVLSREQIRDALEAGDALALGAAEWMGEADRLASEQDFRAVYRALYLALLSGLHTAGKIEHSVTRTNWAYVQRYRGPADERDTFSDLTALFDRVWYGRKPPAGDDLPTLQRKVSTLTTGRSPA